MGSGSRTCECLPCKQSLERIGRFDENRARTRFIATYSAECTRHIEADGNSTMIKSDGLALDDRAFSEHHQLSYQRNQNPDSMTAPLISNSRPCLNSRTGLPNSMRPGTSWLQASHSQTKLHSPSISSMAFTKSPHFWSAPSHEPGDDHHPNPHSDSH